MIDESAPGKLYNRRKTAAYLGVAESTIYRWLKRGEMIGPFTRICGRNYWRLKQLEEFKSAKCARQK